MQLRELGFLIEGVLSTDHQAKRSRITRLTRAHLLVVAFSESEKFHYAAEIQLQWQRMEIIISCLKTLEN